MAHIHKPGQLTYYIVLNGGNVISYGELQPENCLDTPYNVETFTNRNNYKSRLLELGIDIDAPSTSEVPKPPDFPDLP